MPKDIKKIYEFHEEGVAIELPIPEEKTDDEDTDDASETDTIAMKERSPNEIREQVYRDKLRGLFLQLMQLENGTLPEYQKRLKKLEQTYHWALERIDTDMQLALERAEEDYKRFKSETAREFEEKKIELKENLITELEEKKHQIKSERLGLELTGESMEVKPMTTRKLRRRPHDPLPLGTDIKRRRQSPNLLADALNFSISDSEVLEDLKVINRGKGSNLTVSITRAAVGSFSSSTNYASGGGSSASRTDTAPTKPSSAGGGAALSSGGSEPGASAGGHQAGGVPRLEEGKLVQDGRTWTRGASVVLENTREKHKITGVICAIGSTEAWIRRQADQSKLRITSVQLKEYRVLS